VAQHVSPMIRENYRTNLEYRESVNARMLSLAKRLLSGELGIIAGARELSGFEDEVGQVEPEIGAVLTTFVGISSETDALPVGDERRHWSAAALEREDRKIAEAENTWRTNALDACARLISLIEASGV